MKQVSEYARSDREALLGELAPTGSLRAAIAVGPSGSATWATNDPAAGRPRGVTVSLATALATALRVPLELVVHSSSGEIIANADRGTFDVGFAPVDQERKSKVDFGPNYFLGESTCLVPAGSQILSIPQVDRAGVRVVGVENTATIRSARRAMSRATVIGTTSLDEAFEMLASGKSDALALGRESLRDLASRLPGSRILDGAFHTTGTAIFVPKNKPRALTYVTAFIEAAKTDGTVRRAFDANDMGHAAVAPLGSRS